MSEYLNYILENIEKFWNYEVITHRKMFGGYGIYRNKVIFAIIADDELFLKGYPKGHQKYELFMKNGFEQFTYEAKDRIAKMSYWKVPIDILENSEELYKWCGISWNISLTSKK